MDHQQIQQTMFGMEVLYKATIELYQSYFEALEAAINKTPASDTEKLAELHVLAEEGKQALEDDMALFEKTLSMDAEAINSMQDELKIQSIYKKLQK